MDSLVRATKRATTVIRPVERTILPDFYSDGQDCPSYIGYAKTCRSPYAEWLRLIKEVEQPHPSTRLRIGASTTGGINLMNEVSRVP